jgi:hypothetical protein
MTSERSLFTVSRRALQWRLLLLWWLALALPALFACLPLWAALTAQLDHSLLGARLLQSFDVPVYLEVSMSLAKHGYAPGSGSGGALVFALTLPWLAGITTRAARSPAPPGFAALIHGGLDEYWRMTRLSLWALLPTGLAGAAGAAAIYFARQFGSRATLETDAQRAMLAAAALAALLFILARASVDAACARLVLEPERRSVVVAWWRGSVWLLVRPWRVLPYLLLTAAGLGAAAALAWLRIQTPAVGALGLIAGFVHVQAGVVALVWMRCARLFALAAAAFVPARTGRPTPEPAPDGEPQVEPSLTAGAPACEVPSQQRSSP